MLMKFQERDEKNRAKPWESIQNCPPRSNQDDLFCPSLSSTISLQRSPSPEPPLPLLEALASLC